MSGAESEANVEARIVEPPCTAIVRQAVSVVRENPDWLSSYRRDWALRVLAETVERSNLLTAES